MCKVFFERFSLDLMGKRGAGREVKGGRKMARRAFPSSSYDERRVREREKKAWSGGGRRWRYPDESTGRAGMKGCVSVLFLAL